MYRVDNRASSVKLSMATHASELWRNNDMTTRATEPKRGGSGGHVYIGLIVGVADDSIATAGGNRKKGRGLVQEVNVYTACYSVGGQCRHHKTAPSDCQKRITFRI